MEHRSLLKFRWLALFMMISLLLTAAGCSSSPTENSAKEGDVTGLKMASMQEMPAEIKSAPQTVRQAYQFAAANPDILKDIPCYCGCGAAGHTSNYACYVQSQDEQGKINYDQHALGCSICVDITQDTMRLLDEGKPLAEIRTAIDANYAQYGPSNIP